MAVYNLDPAGAAHSWEEVTGRDTTMATIVLYWFKIKVILARAKDTNMKRTKTSTKIGRTKVAAVSILATSIGIGMFLFAQKAHAQSLGSPGASALSFGPVHLSPATINSTPGSLGTIKVLLPAVQNQSQPFRLVVQTADAQIRLPIVPPVGAAVTLNDATFNVYLASNANGGTLLAVYDSLSGKTATAPTQFSDITARLLPAVQLNGDSTSPLGASMTMTATRTATISDGTTFALPYFEFVPAVQLPAVQ
jgi:hypothetical protein